MTDIMDLDEESRARVIDVLQETGDSHMGHHYSAEEAEAIGAMGARATILYGKLRLERENRATERPEGCRNAVEIYSGRQGQGEGS
jgi:hypothetical protein